MQPLKSSEITGIWASLLLPIDENDNIDYLKLREEVRTLAKTGINGIYSNGSAGEFHAQTEDEFDNINGILAEECEKLDVRFQIGACHMSAIGSLERLRGARKYSPGALQVVLPDWFAPNLEEAVSFLQRLAAEADPIGLVVYNPPHAKKALSPLDWKVLVQEVKQIVGIKTVAGDQAWYNDMVPLFDQISVFVPGHALATGYGQGAAGSYSNVACLSPRGAVRWFDLMQSNPQKALALEKRIQAYIHSHILPLAKEHGYTNAALDKLLAAIGGWTDVGTRLRWPYRSVPTDVIPSLRRQANRDLPELFTDVLDPTR